MTNRIELLVTRSQEGSGPLLSAPSVGLVYLTIREGELLAPGQVVGTFSQLGRRRELVVPPAAHGYVQMLLDGRRPQPIEFAQPLMTLESLSEEREAAPAEESPSQSGEIVAPQSGRFYQRPSPSEPPFSAAGRALEPGEVIGLLEVMKTFTQVRVPQDLESGLVFDHYLVEDGAEVTKGEPVAALTEATS